ncbi:hypothetical protein GVN21_07500 [Caulobacter sp. SLTY]|uniref:hypothetical protein n=1 Tax=Caulobacter sp. SLTY TaxID=2683262 RepID=UPI00141311E4|nr:hypothetical protein [Caulobacter sp. SLTY]NBB15199.1 hypothetical protein [Caulobacter sp. SLTY]
MTSLAHVLRRSRRLAGPPFPATPTLPFGEAWPGLAVVLAQGATGPDLRALRERIDGLWRGPLDGEGVEVLLVSFIAPVLLTEATVPGALPLAAGHAGVLRSFFQEAATPGTPFTKVPVRRLELLWGGRVRRIALEALAPQPLEALWDLPRLHMHPQAAPRRAAAGPAVVGEGRGEGEPDGLLPVGRSELTLTGRTQILSDAVEESMAALRDRTKLSNIFRQMFLGDGRAGGQGKAGPWGQAPAPKGPTAMENLAGWLRWHTPLGDPLRRSMAERMKLVEKLLASGDLDSALKLAMALGSKASELRDKILPNRLWDARSSLDFNITGSGFSMPILGGGSFDSLYQRYRNLAEQLERDGDWRRAAFVYAQLLDDHAKAVTALEKGGMLREAAKLAIDARLPPVRAIRLLYKAGELDAALTLAKQAACFEELAQDSKGNAGYHAFVVKAWTDMLVGTDQPLRALQVTDALAGEADGALAGARRRWLERALRLRGEDPPGAELTARGLLTADWTPDDISPEGIEAFPDMPRIAGQGPLPALLADLQTLLAGPGEAEPQDLLDLLHAFTRLGDEGRSEQAAFWARPAPAILEALALGLVERAAVRLGQAELAAMSALLGRAGLSVLAVDLDKLNRLHRPTGRSLQHWRLPAADVQRSPVRRACLLAGGDMLAWRENDQLQLFDRHGAPLWQGTLSGVLGLVPVGQSPSALVIQAGEDGAVTLSRFLAGPRRMLPIGRVRLSAWHDVTSESQWLVQIDGDIGALDLVALCAPRPQVRFLWSVALTEQVQAVAFAHDPAGPGWITRDVGPRPGVLESWTRSPAGVLTTNLLIPQGATPSDVIPPADWSWRSHSVTRIGEGRGVMVTLPWTREREREAAARARAVLDTQPAQLDRFLPGDLGRAYARLPDPETDTPTATITLHDHAIKQALFRIEHDPDALVVCLARSPGRGVGVPNVRSLLFADRHGRLIAVELPSGNVVVA